MKAGEFVIKDGKALIVKSHSVKRPGCKITDVRPIKRIRGKNSIANLELSVSVVSAASDVSVINGSIRSNSKWARAQLPRRLGLAKRLYRCQ